MYTVIPVHNSQHATLIRKKPWNVPIRQLVTFSEMEWSLLKTKSFHLQFVSLEIGNEINLFGNEIWHFITIYYIKDCFHCWSETNHIVNENFSFPKRIVSFQNFFLSVYSYPFRNRTILIFKVPLFRISKFRFI